MAQTFSVTRDAGCLGSTLMPLPLERGYDVTVLDS